MKITNWLGKVELNKILDEPGYHFLIFAAKWCGFCTRFVSTAAKLDDPTNTELLLINADDPDESLWNEYSIRVVPTMVLVKDRNQVFRKDGRSMIGLSESELREGLVFLSNAG